MPLNTREGVAEAHATPAPASDVLPNGRPAFAVTQPFGVVNPAYPHLGPHTGLDVGNFNCGDHVLAAASGTARTMRDTSGALIVIIRHSDGYETVYAHLAGFTIPTGVSTEVLRGQRIGSVGATGLGAGCHLHFEIKLNGTHQDPWPLLAQNREAQMLIKGSWINHIANRSTVISNNGSGGNARSGPALSEPVVRTFPDGTAVRPIAQVGGDRVGGSNIWYAAINYVQNQGWMLLYYHETVLRLPLAFIEPGVGISQANYDAAVQAARAEGASIAANEALRAVTTVVNRYPRS